ncbi:MAG: YkgJ family cysteine cluster protein [Pseudomonadales bacterium]
MATEFLELIELDESRDLAAGDVGIWLDEMSRALDEPGEMRVPCGSCNACCRSAYFIHIGAGEVETLARIPRALLVPAPGRPEDRVMGFDERGHCPMLVGDACSIYPQRPLTCRRFDCRVFAAAGVDPSEDGKTEVAARTRRWRFDYARAHDRRRHAAVVTAARLLDENRRQLGRAAPANRTQQAVQAVACHEAVLELADEAAATGKRPGEQAILAAIRPADPDQAP